MLLAALLIAGCGAAPKADGVAYRCQDTKGRVMSMVASASECRFHAGEWQVAPPPAPAPAPPSR
jgi:hypothetical protein